MPVASGLDRLIARPELVPDRPTVLVGNYVALTDDLRSGVDALATTRQVVAVAVPEHGYWGAVQAGESEGGDLLLSDGSALPVVETYQQQSAALAQLLADTGAEQLVFDLVDIGARFYTNIWTLYDVLCAAATIDLPVVVLDRPNPLGSHPGRGPGLVPSASSFVGRVSIPLLHGLTTGELARWFAAEFVPAATGRAVDLDVVWTEGWDGRGWPSGAAWVPSSPNMPTLDTVRLYPATCWLEGTTLSEGRGTTSPFSILGAPWLGPDFAAELSELLPELPIREARYRPTFSKHAGELCIGAQLHPRQEFDPLLVAMAVLGAVQRRAGDRPLWIPPTGGSGHFIDLLWGSDVLRTSLPELPRDPAAALAEVLAASPAPAAEPTGIRHHRTDGSGSPT